MIPREAVDAMVRVQAASSFTDPASVEDVDEKALGIIVAMYLKWDRDAILRCASAALQDANFEVEAADLVSMVLDG